MPDMSKIALVGRLISTTDMRIADKIGDLVDAAEILAREKPRGVKWIGGNLTFYTGGEFYEIGAI